MSAGVGIVMIGGALATMSHHGAVYRDRYASLEDCRRDWGNDGRDCEQSSGSGSRVQVYGPRYESGYRPATRASELRTGTDQVARAGFGRSGARFGGGS
jgi:hypothetical protein